MGLPVLGKMPIMPELSALSDKGSFELIENDKISDAVKAISELN